MIFKRKPKIEEKTIYTLTEDDVSFFLDDLTFSFETIEFELTDEFVISVKNEVAANVTHLKDAVQGMDEVDVDPLGNELIDFTIKLNDYLYSQLKEEMLEAESPETLFDLEHDGNKTLRDLDNYRLISYNIQN